MAKVIPPTSDWLLRPWARQAADVLMTEFATYGSTLPFAISFKGAVDHYEAMLQACEARQTRTMLDTIARDDARGDVLDMAHDLVSMVHCLHDLKPAQLLAIGIPPVRKPQALSRLRMRPTARAAGLRMAA